MKRKRNKKNRRHPIHNNLFLLLPDYHCTPVCLFSFSSDSGHDRYYFYDDDDDGDFDHDYDDDGDVKKKESLLRSCKLFCPDDDDDVRMIV